MNIYSSAVTNALTAVAFPVYTAVPHCGISEQILAAAQKVLQGIWNEK